MMAAIATNGKNVFTITGPEGSTLNTFMIGIEIPNSKIKSSGEVQLIPRPRNPNSEPIIQSGFRVKCGDRAIVITANMLIADTISPNMTTII